jgi:O-antigen biosynthesis protein WbqP
MTPKRLLDLTLVIPALIILAPFMALIALVVRLTSPGPVVFWSTRVGRDNSPFRMPKFRTMRVNAPLLPTDQMTDPGRYLTPIGPWLRSTSLDELPQLWSVLVGDMSVVGPRPALPSQQALNEARTAAGVHRLRPGITGWAQVNGRDDISDTDKLRFDGEYVSRQSLIFDLLIILYTLRKVLLREGIRH